MYSWVVLIILVSAFSPGILDGGGQPASSREALTTFPAIGKPYDQNKQGEEIQLVIWDETDDMKLGNHVRYEGDIVKFYAFYGRGRKSIRDRSVTCMIQSEIGKAPMRFNEKLGLYTFEKRAHEAGTYTWTVHCGGGTYPELTKTDELVVLPLQEDLYRQIVKFKETYDFAGDPALRKEPGAYPRLLNRFNISRKYLDTNYKGMNLNKELALALSKWDVVVPQLYNIKKFSLETHLQIHHLMKEHNPHLTLLMYIPGGDFPKEGGGLFSTDIYDMLKKNHWYARTPDGSIFPPGKGWGLIQYTLNAPASRYSEYISEKMTKYSSFDGVWLDLMRGEQVIRKWFEKSKYEIDLDRDGLNDVKQHGIDWVVERLQSGYVEFLKDVRERLGDGKIIVGNPGVPWEVNARYDDSAMFTYANGNMKEGGENVTYVLKTGIEGAILNEKLAYPKPQRMFVINLQNRNPDNVDRGMMRYGLTMTLMTDAYFSFDSNEIEEGGHRYHNQIYWWPENNVVLGFPVSDFTIRKDGEGREYYFREFDRGIVVGNSGKKAVTVKLGKTYRDVSSGDVSSTFSIQPQDGRILVPSETD